MTRPFREVELPVALRPPGAVPALPAPERLAHASRADGALHELSARRVRVGLTGVGGLRWLEGDGIPLAGKVGLQAATGANLLVAPRATRRELFGPAGGMLEALQLPEALPGVILQWSRTGPGAGAEATLELLLLPEEGGGKERAPTLIHAAPGLLWLAREDRGVLVLLPGEESTPELEAGPQGVGVRFPLTLPGGDTPLTLLLQSAPPSGGWTAPGALAGVQAHHRRGEAAAWGEGEGGLVVETGVAELDGGVRRVRGWLRDRVRTRPGRDPDVHPVRPDPAEAFPGTDLGRAASLLGPGTGAGWLALAAAASGDREAGRSALASLEWDTPAARLLSAAALARWTAWTGETSPLEEAWDRIGGLLADPAQLEGVPGEALEAVRRALTSAGEAASLPPLPEARPGRTRRLPVLGGASAGNGAPPEPAVPARRFLLGLLSGGREGVSPELRVAEALSAREGLGRMEGAPHLLASGVGALALLGVVHGILGVDPDAPFGRVGLSPLLPPHWTRFRAEGLRVGDASLGLDYLREGTRVRWTLTPREGSVPVMAVFQPWLPLQGIGAVQVDGEPAQVEVQEAGPAWARISLQLPVDRVRTVEVEGGPVSPSGPSGSPPP